MRTVRLLPLSLCVLLFPVLSACGGSRLAGTPANGAGNLPALAELPSAVRHTAADAPYTFAEADRVASSATVLMVGTELVLPKPGLKWAVLGANFGQATATQLTVTGVCHDTFIMVSDYSTGRWLTLAGPTDTAESYALPAGIMRADGSLFFAFVCADQADCDVNVSVNLTGLPDPIPETWNVMVWIAADNNLAEFGVEDLNEMEAVGSNENVRIFAGFDIDPAWVSGPVAGIDQVHFIKVVPDSDLAAINVNGDPANVSFPRVGYNSANPTHVREFVDWVQTNFPATHNALVLWDHGSGWRAGTDGTDRSGSANLGADAEAALSAMRTHHAERVRAHSFLRPDKRQRALTTARGGSAVLGDDTEGQWDLTNNVKLVEALSGLHFDVLAFDACNMAHLESLYDYRGLADVLAGSQILVPGPGFPYTEVVAAFNALATRDAAGLGQSIVDPFVSHYTASGEYVTFTSADGAALDALAAALAALATDVTAKAAVEADYVKQAILLSFEAYGGDGTRDLQGFLAAYRTLTADDAIKTLIDNATAALDTAVLAFGEFQQAGAFGMGAYLPDTYYFDPSYQQEYEALAFNQDTHWLDMLKATGVPDVGGSEYDVTSQWAPGDIVKLEWADPAANVDLGTMDPDFNFHTPLDGPDTPNMTFSPDSATSGLMEEWAQVKPGATPGGYYFDAYWSTYDGTPAGPLAVSVKLYDSALTLKEDLGTCNLIAPGSYVGYAVLSFVDLADYEVQADWLAGDYLQIEWTELDTDVDLHVMDPAGLEWAPYYGPETDNLFFSEDGGPNGLSYEWTQLRTGALTGDYLINIEWYNSGNPPPVLSVTVKLLDSAMQLKQDLGVCDLTMVGENDGYAILHSLP